MGIWRYRKKTNYETNIYEPISLSHPERKKKELSGSFGKNKEIYLKKKKKNRNQNQTNKSRDGNKTIPKQLYSPPLLSLPSPLLHSRSGLKPFPIM